jgi:hypothetical protein
MEAFASSFQASSGQSLSRFVARPRRAGLHAERGAAQEASTSGAGIFTRRSEVSSRVGAGMATMAHHRCSGAADLAGSSGGLLAVERPRLAHVRERTCEPVCKLAAAAADSRS